jgi:hypothetical protein
LIYGFRGSSLALGGLISFRPLVGLFDDSDEEHMAQQSTDDGQELKEEEEGAGIPQPPSRAYIQ